MSLGGGSSVKTTLAHGANKNRQGAGFGRWPVYGLLLKHVVPLNFLHWPHYCLELPSDCLQLDYPSTCMRKARSIRVEAFSVGCASAFPVLGIAGVYLVSGNTHLMFGDQRVSPDLTTKLKRQGP